MSDAYDLFHLLEMARLNEQLCNSRQAMIEAQIREQQMCCTATSIDSNVWKYEEKFVYLQRQS